MTNDSQSQDSASYDLSKDQQYSNVVDSCRFVQLLVDRNRNCDLREQTFELSFKFRFNYECFTLCKHHEHR